MFVGERAPGNTGVPNEGEKFKTARCTGCTVCESGEFVRWGQKKGSTGAAD